jgi:hypothetical protein
MTGENNTTIVLENAADGSSIESVPVVVKQGPPWLVDLYLTPPPWLNPLLKTVAIVVAAVVAYRLYQRGWEIDLATQREMQLTVATIVGVISGVLAMVNYTAQPYMVDVGVGFAAGYGAALAPQSRLVPVRWPQVLQDPADRAALTWVLLALAAYALPAVAGSPGKGMQLTTSRLILAGIALAMVAYNAVVFEAE